MSLHRFCERRHWLANLRPKSKPVPTPLELVPSALIKFLPNTHLLRYTLQLRGKEPGDFGEAEVCRMELVVPPILVPVVSQIHRKRTP
jgi:hypothetical protein